VALNITRSVGLLWVVVPEEEPRGLEVGGSAELSKA